MESWKKMECRLPIPENEMVSIEKQNATSAPARHENPEQMDQPAPTGGGSGAAPCSASVDRRFKTAIVSESGRVIWWVNYDDPNAISHKRWIDLIGLAVNQALEFGLRNEALYLLSNARPCSSEIESILRETTSPPRLVLQTNSLEYTLNPSDSRNPASFVASESNISNPSSVWISKSALSNLVGIDEFIIWGGDNAAPAAMQEQQQKPNVQDEPTAESRSASAAEAGREPQPGGGSAPSLCSALDERPIAASEKLLDEIEAYVGNPRFRGASCWTPFRESDVPDAVELLKLIPTMYGKTVNLHLEVFENHTVDENHSCNDKNQDHLTPLQRNI